jgi:hypothetical protein
MQDFSEMSFPRAAAIVQDEATKAVSSDSTRVSIELFPHRSKNREAAATSDGGFDGETNSRQPASVLEQIDIQKAFIVAAIAQ